MKLRFKIAAMALLVSPFAAAQAVPMTFFGEDLGGSESNPVSAFTHSKNKQSKFLSYITNYGIEDFEGFGDNETAPLSISFANGVGATLTGSGRTNLVSNGSTDGKGRYAISGDTYWNSGDDFSVRFDQPVNAFGFYGTDVGDYYSTLTITIDGELSHEYTLDDITVGGSNNGGSVMFWGIYSPGTTFTSITFGYTNGYNDVFGFDDFIAARAQQTSVPGPGALLLMFAGLGLVTFGVAQRRRQS